MNIIKADNLHHSYIVYDKMIKSLSDISLEIKKGEFVAVIGRNGCGKSTLLRHFNMLLPLQKGELFVAGYDAKDEKSVYKVRRKCSMVFQNPDSQFVSSLVKEDIAFGLKNFGLPYDDNAVSQALAMVDLNGFENRNVQTLSGGQKQRLALAGVLAINPDIILLDEPTTMLDPLARKKILDIILSIHANTSSTIVMVTQFAEEALLADRVLVMDAGRIVADGTPERIFTDNAFLESAGLEQPLLARLYCDLKNKGIDVGAFPENAEGLVDYLCR